jgi:glucose/arabinose dehydrogenase
VGATLDFVFTSARRLALLLFVIVTLATALAVPMTGAEAATSSVPIGSGLRGPKGLAATVYATGLKKISALATDAHGRVWAATAEASDKNTDAIYLVTAAGATPRQVATDVHTPLGLLWIGDTLYVSESNGVLALGGFDGTSFATRTTVVSFPDGTGEVNGIARGTDGRVYVGISAPCDSCTPTARYAASVVSFLPDGSDLQVVASKIRAPIGLAFFPGTNDLFVTMNQRDDLGKRTPGDWLAQVTAGQSWGFPSCYGQSSTKCRGTPDPVAVLDKHAAVSGVAIVAGQLGSAVGTGAVVAEWVTGSVQFVELTKSSSGYTGTTRAFLTGFKNPVPVLLDATGALFVGDWTTGKVYRITG